MTNMTTAHILLHPTSHGLAAVVYTATYQPIGQGDVKLKLVRARQVSCRLEEVGSFVLLGVQYLTRLRIICPTRNVEIKLAEKSDPF